MINSSFRPNVLLRIAASVFCWAALWGGTAAQAQLDREMRNLFLEIKDQLEPDLTSKFDRALEQNTEKIKFSRSEFERFRDHPANPFDGLFELEESVYRNGIELKFELPNLRNRMIGRNERQSGRLLGSLQGVGDAWNRSVVEVLVDGQVVALATVVDPAGWLVTKASELSGAALLAVKSFDGKVYPAKIVRSDQANDLAVLQTSAEGLVAVRFATVLPEDGAFLVTIGAGGKPLALGSLSHGPRALPASEQAVLGIQPQDAGEGCELVEVTRGGAGDKAGLRAGDVVVGIDSRPIDDVTDLVNEIRRRRPGTSVSLEVLRQGQRHVIAATLAGRNVSPDNAARFKMMNRLGAIPSARAADFPWVLQHDTPLFPEQCGGPLLDLEGNVIGLNIARQGRIASLAIPGEQLVQLLPELAREELAEKERGSGR